MQANATKSRNPAAKLTAAQQAEKLLAATAQAKAVETAAAEINAETANTESDNPTIDSDGVRAAQRAIAENILRILTGAASNPIKPIDSFKAYKRESFPHANNRKPSERQSAALAIAIVASGQAVTDSVTFSRRFRIDGVQFAIENGASSDILRAGYATYNADSETYTLATGAAKTIAGHLGQPAIRALAERFGK